MCGFDLLLAHDDDDDENYDDNGDIDYDGDIDDDDGNYDSDGKEPSWKLYVRTAFCLGDDCSSGAAEGDSANQTLHSHRCNGFGWQCCYP